MKQIIRCALGDRCTCNADATKPFTVPRSCRQARVEMARPILPAERLTQTMREKSIEITGMRGGIVLVDEFATSLQARETRETLTAFDQAAQMMLEALAARPDLEADNAIFTARLTLEAVLFAHRKGA